MERRSFLLRAGVLSGATVVGLSGLGSLSDAMTELTKRLGEVPAGEPPAHIGGAEIGELQRLAALYEAEAHRLGGEGAEGSTLYADGLASVKLAQGMLSGTCPPHLLPQLQAAVAWLFRAVGFMAFDVARRTIAEDILWAAHELAATSGDVSLEARVVGTRARQDAWEGDPMRAAGLVSRMLERGRDRLTPTEQAMLHGVHARSLARLGRGQAVFRAIGEADEAFAASAPGETQGRPWVSFYDFAHEQGETARALLDLGLGMPAGEKRTEVLTNAGARCRQAIGTSDPEANRRSTAFTMANLATVQLALGHPEDALAHGREAVGAQGVMTSRRMDAHLRMMRTACGDFCGGNPHAGELSERVGLALV